MMGSPYYYEVHFDPIDVVFHDCMWSGTCCIQLVQQPPETVVQQQQEQEQRQSAVEQLAHQISLSSSSQVPHVKQLSPPQECKQTSGVSTQPPKMLQQQHHNQSQQSKRLESSSSSSCGGSESSFETEPKCEPVKQTRQQAKQHASRHHQLHLHRKHEPFSKAFAGDNSASNNKKLRHREVEKNRHRQLQAMVKTLSDCIPGKIDKETQVQTMKRAAKYCLYLRDVLTHGPPVTKEKLERIYSKSCENVDLLMASD